MGEDDRYLSITWGRITVICQLHEEGWQLSVSYIRQVGCYMSATWGMMTAMADAWDRMTVICQLHEAGCQLSVSYMRQDDDYLSVTWGKMMVIRQLHEAGPLSVTSVKMTVICQLHEAGWRLSVTYMRQVGGYLSVIWGRMADIFQIKEAG